VVEQTMPFVYLPDNSAANEARATELGTEVDLGPTTCYTVR